MRRRLAIVAAALVMIGCSTQPPPTGPGTATFDISGSKGECFSFGGCSWVVILRTDDVPQALNDEHDAELLSFPDFQGTQLLLGRGLPHEIEDGDYTLSFEERLISDSQGNQGPLAYAVGSTCSTGFNIGPGKSVVIVRVAFAGAVHEHPPCSIALKIKAAS